MATACPFVVAATRCSARRAPARPSMIATILTGRLGSWSTWRSRTSEAAEMSVRATAVRAPSAGGRPSAVGRTTRRRDGQTGQVTDVIRVDDPADPRLADYLRLTDSSLRTSLEAAHGMFIAEGEKVIRRALRAGYPVRSLLVTPDRVAGLAGMAGAGPVYVITHDVAERITGYRVHRGALASMARRPLPGVGDVVAGHDRILVLEDLVDHGNVGAIFRCAAALGVGAVVLAPRCADPLYRRAVQGAVGAGFAIPYARMTDWYGGPAGLRAAGFRLLAPGSDQAAAPPERVAAGG